MLYSPSESFNPTSLSRGKKCRGLNLSAISRSRAILTPGPQTLISDGLIRTSFGGNAISFTTWIGCVLRPSYI